MKYNNKEKSMLRIILPAIILYFAILRIDKVLDYGDYILTLLKPFIIGGVIAFIINVPMVKIEKRLKKAKIKKFRRGISFLITVTGLGAAVYAFLMVVVPQLADTISTLIIRLQIFINSIPVIIESHSENLSFIEEFILSQNIDWQDISSRLARRMQNFALELVNSGTGVLSGILEGFTTALFSLIFAIYILMGKERNTKGLRRLSKAVFGRNISSRIDYVMALTYKNFSNFLSGQCLEAVILGGIFVIAMTIFKLPYALLIGIVIAVTALIPVFGAFIGCIFGLVLIAIESPAQAVGFLVMFLILQQLEGNLIYPRVVGNSIGLPSILVFMSVIIGNSLMGVVGMLVFIPAVSILYTLTKEFVLKQEEKEIILTTEENQ